MVVGGNPDYNKSFFVNKRARRDKNFFWTFSEQWPFQNHLQRHRSDMFEFEVFSWSFRENLDGSEILLLTVLQSTTWKVRFYE